MQHVLLTWSLSLLQKNSTCSQNLKHATCASDRESFCSTEELKLFPQFCNMQHVLLTWSLSLLQQNSTCFQNLKHATCASDLESFSSAEELYLVPPSPGPPLLTYLHCFFLMMATVMNL